MSALALSALATVACFFAGLAAVVQMEIDRRRARRKTLPTVAELMALRSDEP